MSDGRRVSLVCLGLIGTMAQDAGMREHAFAEACATQGIVPGTADYAHCMVAVHQSLGQPAVEVFRGLFPDSPGRAEAAALSFERSFRAVVDRAGLSPVPGAEEAIGLLRDSGVRVCVVTGLSRRLLGMVLETLGWWRQIDLALSPEDVPRGYPWPDLVLAAMLRLGVQEVGEAGYAGTTASGILCAKRAGAGTLVGVLAGGHTRERLRAAGATHFITGIPELPALLLGDSAEVGRAEDPDPPQLSPAEHDADERNRPGPVTPQSSAPRTAPGPRVP